MRNLVDLLSRSCERFADRPAFATKRGGRWEWTSYRQLGELTARCRAGLRGLGVGRGDVVAVVAGNSIEWAVAAYATYGLEAALVPLYEAQRPSEWEFILRDCGAKVVFARTGKPYEHLAEARSGLPTVEHLIGLGLPGSDPSSFESLLEVGDRAPIEPGDPAPTLTAGLIYTSGTTGEPKGVILSHGNLASNAATGAEVFPLTPDDRLLSFLPWAHSYGQLELNWALTQGAALALNDHIERLLPNLAEVKPTVLVTVPRVFQLVYEAVRNDMAQRSPMVRKLFEGGVRYANRKSRGERGGALGWLQLAVDDKLIFSKIRERFGGRLKYVLCASAALEKEVAEFVDAIGLNVYEGYGLTETSPMVTANVPGARRLGSVGKVIPGVRIVIAPVAGGPPGQGEIVVYGPNVMQGYHNRPAENERAFTADGGLRTGDLGYLDDDGFLYIIGRIKEQYKLQNGKYVMPGPLEERLKLSRYIAHVMLHGANRPYNVALVALDAAAVRVWASEHGITLEDPARDPRVERLILDEILRLSALFRGYEVPRRVLLTASEFTTGNDLLTPTLKLRRRKIEQRFGAALAAVYAKPAADDMSSSVEAPGR